MKTIIDENEVKQAVCEYLTKRGIRLEPKDLAQKTERDNQREADEFVGFEFDYVPEVQE